jgi:hypothetical protein
MSNKLALAARYELRRVLCLPLDFRDQLVAHRRAVARGERELDEMTSGIGPEHCCPGCALGRPYSKACDAQEARRETLARLERKWRFMRGEQ